MLIAIAVCSMKLMKTKETIEYNRLCVFPLFCSMAPSEEPGPSTLEVCEPQPEASLLSAAATLTPSLLDRKLELEMDVLRQHKKALCILEEYYKLNIELLKNKLHDKQKLCIHVSLYQHAFLCKL